MTGLYAHTPNADGTWHGLEEHLRGTASRARDFGRQVGPEAADLAYYAGLWHDLGKARRQFQQYLQDQSAGLGHKGEGGDHKGAGAVHSRNTCGWLPFAIAGHHGGLAALSDLQSKLAEWQRPDSHVPEALTAARAGLGALMDPPAPLQLPGFVRTPHQSEFLLRVLFSCLVDADFLDTEVHFNPAQTVARSPHTIDVDLWQTLSVAQEARIADAVPTPVNIARQRVYRAALEAAAEPAGFFRLTVPTGGGKTLTSLAFALKHALRNDLRRVIVAVPYTTITEQTAATYREIFASRASVVLEHHSAISHNDHSDVSEGQELWRRLAAENWDAPIVVTTTVQLFSSLLGASTSVTRKLHNLVGCVIVLDEVQALPARLLTPLLDVLRELVSHYRVSVVLCTATQPAFDAIRGFQQLQAREIAPNPPELFATLARVTYDWPQPGTVVSWSDVAELMQAEPQVLAVVNTKKDALSLLDALGDAQAFHLSTLLCGAHRRDVLKTIRQRLEETRPCCLVATQVIEAGVDISFPVVLRALGPLDSIVQAAGRCNREGLLGPYGGRVFVFQPADGGMPPGDYAVAAQQTATLLSEGPLDVDHPDVFLRYFGRLFPITDTDKPKVQAARQSLDYPKTAYLSKLIEDDTVPLIVRYRGPSNDDDTVDRLLTALRDYPQATRTLLRQLQPFVVLIRKRQLERYQREGWIQELVAELGVFEWTGGYDIVRGIETSFSPDDLIV